MSDTPLAPPPPDPGPRGRLALTVAAAVDTVDGARRSGDGGVEVATQYRGGRVVGVRLGDAQIEVHVVAEHPDVAVVAGKIQVAARRALDLVGDRRKVMVFVDDLDVVSLSPRGS